VCHRNVILILSFLSYEISYSHCDIIIYFRDNSLKTRRENWLFFKQVILELMCCESELYRV
jgi:hypothetical protein